LKREGKEKRNLALNRSPRESPKKGGRIRGKEGRRKPRTSPPLCFVVRQKNEGGEGVCGKKKEGKRKLVLP